MVRQYSEQFTSFPWSLPLRQWPWYGKWLFNAEYGIINIVLGALHLPSKIQWISDPKTALLACAIVTIWSSVGYDAILLLSGLQSISKSYYEAARIDGAKFFPAV